MVMDVGTADGSVKMNADLCIIKGCRASQCGEIMTDIMGGNIAFDDIRGVLTAGSY